MNTRKKKAEYLFDEIGGIDDRIVWEALSYRERTALPRRVLLVAATLVLSLALVLTAAVVAMLQTTPSDKAPPQSPPQATAPLEEVPNVNAPLTLDGVLLALRDSQCYTEVTDAAQLDYFAGSAQVVWQYANTQSLCVSRPLRSQELLSLSKYAKDGTETEGADTDSAACRVWILLGDGTVITPYLKISQGNVGAAELFDYNAEVIPSQSFNSALSDILNS